MKRILFENAQRFTFIVVVVQAARNIVNIAIITKILIDTTNTNMIRHQQSGIWGQQTVTHSGGERSLGETKYIIGDSYTVGKVRAGTFGIN